MIKLFFKYFKYLKKYIPYLALIFLGDLLVTNIGLVTPLFSRILFDYAYPLRELFLLNVVVLASVGLYFLEFFINVSSDYLGTYVDQSVTFDMTKNLFRKCQKLTMKFHSKTTAGDLVNRFTTDLDTVVGEIITTIPEIILQLYALVSILFIALFMNYKITLLALCSVPIYILETKFFSKKEEAIEEEDIALNSDYIDTLQEKFKSIRTIKAFGQEETETNRLAEKRRIMNVVAIKQGLISIISIFANSVTVRMWSIFLMWYMGFLVIQGQLTVGEIVALMAYVAMIGGPVQSLSQMYTELRVSMVSFRRLDEIFTAESEEDDNVDHQEINIDDGLVHFDAVDFSYNEKDRKILDSLSFKLGGKTAVAIVGESGSGKSTIIALLMRFYSTNEGGIYIDNQKISDVKIKSLRSQIGLVQQDFTLFAGTLRDNLMYGNDSKNEEQLIAACKDAQIYDFIESLEDGFEHVIGFQGEGLSGGQKQRIAIARVLLKDPPIIIFDEATSALDPESEYKITEVMNHLVGQKNLFIIAHRLSTIKKVDVILMLEQGRIIEQGSFEELINKKGAFFRYYSLQFGGFDVFKKMLEIEYERVSRYNSQFNLVLVTALNYQKLREEENGEEVTEQFMLDLNLAVKRSIRKGDSCAHFKEGYILILLPEINEEGVRGFYNRESSNFKGKTLEVQGKEIPIQLSYTALHVEATPFATADDVIQETIKLSKESNQEDLSFSVKSISKKEEPKS